MTTLRHGYTTRYKPDDVRTSEGRKVVGWQMPVQEILQHVMACEKECPQLGIALDRLFGIVSDYQKQAA
jgi:hypothetical protein